MKFHQSIALLTLGLVPALLLCINKGLAQNVPEVVPNVVVVQFEAGVSLAGKTASTGLQVFDRKAAAYGVHTIERMYPFLDHVDPTPKTLLNLLALRRTYYARYSADVPPERVSRDLALAPGVVYAELVPVNRTQGPEHWERIDPNDPGFNDQPELRLMRLPEAWDVVKSSDSTPKVVIAIVDDGSEWRHEDLRANVWTNEDEIPGNGIDDDNNGFIDDVHGVSFFNGDGTDNDPTPFQGNRHGTSVSGVASAVTDNNVGITGAAWNAEMMHVNNACPDYDGICDGYAGILYAAMNGADIINASWGSLVRNDQRVRHADQAIDLATDMGALVVSSAGNSSFSNDLFRKYPARSPRVLSVGATEKATPRRAGFTNYGRLVNVFAPGIGILTTGVGNSYVLINGTSFSSPLTAGVAALVKTRFPTMDPDALREHIRLTSESIDQENPGFAGQLGRGLVNALAAVQVPTLPAVRLKRWSWTDQDGDRQIASGDVVTITATMVNYLSDARGLNVGLVGAEPYPFLDMTNAEVGVGFLAGGDSIEVQFKFRVAADAPNNQWVRLYTRIRDGAFEDSADQLTFRVNHSLEAAHRSLSAFYRATDGDNWIHNDNWDITRVPSEEELATWVGVGLNEGFLVELLMETNNLRGTLPSELGNLQYLQKLGLLWNEGLSGSIPPELGILQQLQFLWLVDNSLSGPIPPELGNLEQLRDLSLNDNSLSGPIPPELGNLEKLQELWLHKNSLSGPIPSELGNLEQLRELRLWGNSVSGSIPSKLGNLEQLERLSLSQNSLTGSIPPELGNLEQLEWLSLWDNSLTGSIPSELGNLEQLERLYLSQNFLSGSIPPELGNLVQLWDLNLRDNSLSGPIPPELGRLGQLQELWLYSNSLTGSIPGELGNLESLERLSLSQNSLTGSVPRELGNLERLEWLSLSQNSLTGSIPSELGNLEQLESLYLWGNSLSGSIPRELKNLKQLKILSLSRNSLTGSIPSELGSLERLELLYMWGNSLSGPIPSELGNLEQLQELSLSYNSLSGPIPSEFGNLERLEDLWLHNNSLSGPIPPELGNLDQLQELSLSRNFLSGSIPPELKNLEQLKILHLSQNSLIGPIPPELGDLERLEWLYLSGNSLSGSIPPELGNLSRLKRLVLSENALTGRLPRSLMQLDSLETFYFGEQNLCAPTDDEFQMWLNRIPDYSGPTCLVSGGGSYADIHYDQGEAVGAGDGNHLFVGLPTDARMATRFVIDTSSGGKQWNRTISGNDREARTEAISRVDRVTRIEAPSLDDQKTQIEEVLGNRPGRTDLDIGPEEWKKLIKSIGTDSWEWRVSEYLEDEWEQKRMWELLRDVWKERVEVSSGDERENADQRVSTSDRGLRALTHVGGERDGRFRPSSRKDRKGRLGTSSADGREVRIDRIWLAPYYDNQFSNTTLPTDAPRDFTVYIYSDRDGAPGDILFSKEVEDPRPYAGVTNFALDFFELDLSNEGIDVLPDTIHIAYGNAGTDDNLLISGPAPYTEKNISHVYFQGAWHQLWDLTTTDGDSFNETMVPIRARFWIQSPLQFVQAVADQSFIQGHSITPLVLPEATGGVSPIGYSLAPALPAGLAFDASTRTISGTPTEATTVPVTMTYTATDATGGTVTMQFSVEVFSSVDIQVEAIPSTFALHGNYPNPFAGSTRIVFDLPSAAMVSADVLDITGRRLRRVPARMLEAGWNRGIDVSGAGLPSGVYLYRMHVDLPEDLIIKSGSFMRIR